MDKNFLHTLLTKHTECTQCPSKEEVSSFYTKLLGTLFPNFSNEVLDSESAILHAIKGLKTDLAALLISQQHQLPKSIEEHVDSFFSQIPEVYQALVLDVEAMHQGDPAARSTEEVIRSYPGFYAIAAYRFAHQLYKQGIQIIPRMITEHAHNETGIDIHPGATIGSHFCIDHGTGIVIGETTVIGNRVKIYQGVTLGALSVRKEDAKLKRHPTIEDDVVLYANATILGGKTVIGRGSMIGGNVWLTDSVEADTRVTYQTKVIQEQYTPNPTHENKS